MVRTAARPVSHRRRRVARRKSINKRKTNWLRLSLWLAVGVLVGECVAVAFLSPRFRIKQVALQGTRLLSNKQVTAQFSVPPTQNLFLAPVREWERAIERLPKVAHASIVRKLPGNLQVVVTERQPWASVRTQDGIWHVVDADFIPFRTTKHPEAGFLRILASDFAPWEALPGIPLPSVGLNTARECAHWAKIYQKFPLSQIEIDIDSKVSLSHAGGVRVLLGSEEKIQDKLTSLEKLLAERSDLLDSDRIAYINLFAADAPAIGLKIPTINNHKNQ